MTEPEATPEETPTPKSAGMVDLSDLRMMPAWVAGMSSPSNLNRYEEREDRGPRREGGPGRRDGDRRGGPPPRRDGGGFGGGPGGQNRDRGGFAPRRDGPPGQGGGPRRDDRGGPRRFGDRDRNGPGQDRPQREWVEIPKDIKVIIEPEDKSAETLAHHIRTSGHAFSMFDAARLVLAEGERFHARFSCAPERPTGLFVTPADGGLFLSREEALSHVLRSPAIESYYKVEEIEIEEPKGDFKSIGICGITGELLGPPSHHSFQSSLLRLHRERFANMPLEDYKRRLRTETSPEIVAQWKEKQRKGQRWVYLKNQAEGEEPVTLSTRAEMEAHFRRTHGEDAAIEGREIVIPGSQDKQKITHILGIMMRSAVEGARKHLFEMSQKLGGGFERRGLKLFKRRAGKLFVCRVKPRAVDPGVVFSERVSKIVEVLKTTPGMPLGKLVEAIVPSATPIPEGEAKPQLTDDQISVLKDLRWLTNEGYVIEYSDGMVFLGVQGEPHPAKEEKKGKESAKGEVSGAESETDTTESKPQGESESKDETSGAAEAATATDEVPSEVASEDAPVSEEVSDIGAIEGVSLEAQEELNEPSPGPSSDDLEADATEPDLDIVKGEEGPEATEAEAELNKTAAPSIEPEEETLEDEPVAPELPTTIIDPETEEEAKKAE